MENEGKKPKTEPSGISLTPAVKAAGKLMASRRLPHLLTGNFSAYIRDLIERDVLEEIRRDPELSKQIPKTTRDPIVAFIEAAAEPKASQSGTETLRDAALNALDRVEQRSAPETKEPLSPEKPASDVPTHAPTRGRKRASVSGSKRRTDERTKGQL